jgi:small GTP-binding protein
VDTKTWLNDEYQDILQTERTLLWDINRCLRKAGARDADLEHLQTAITQVDELFLLVIVGEFNSGKSAFINALVEQNILEEGPTPTTDLINILKYADTRSVRIVDGVRVTKYPLEFLKTVNIVDTPGTNSLVREHDEVTLQFIPRADFVVFVVSVDRPLTDSEREFLELISLKWKRKVLFLLNKIDTKDEAEITAIVEYLEHEGMRILGVTPQVFPVSARLALQAKQTDDAELLARSQFAEMERYLFEALNETERVRLKLLNPLYAVQPVCTTVGSELEEKLRVLDEDLRRLRYIERQLNYTASDLKDNYSRFILRVENILLDLRNRAYDFVDDFLQIHNIWNIASREKAEVQFNEKVVKDCSEQVETVLTEAADWLVKKSERTWEDTLAYYKQQLHREAHQDKVIGEVGGQFAVDRQQIYQGVIREARTRIQAFDFQKESQTILRAFQNAMLHFAATEVSAIGVGAVLMLIFEALFFDITGILASGVLVTAGFFILPRKRRQAKEAFNQRITELITDLKQNIAAQFDAYMNATFEQIEDTLAPFDRFCRAEHEELTAAHQELQTLVRRLESLQEQIRLKQ